MSGARRRRTKWSRLRRAAWPGRLRAVASILLSREIGVLTNAIAFNFLLCLFPLVLVVVAVAQQLGAGRRVSTGLLLVLQELIPFNHDAIAESLRSLARVAHGIEIVSLVLILWGSSGIFMPVETALNRAWGGPRPHRDFWRSRLLAFLMTTAGGLIVLLSVSLTVAARSYRDEWPRLAGYGAKLSAFLLTYLLFFVIYRFVPDARVGGRVALRAALLAALAWESLKYGFVVKLGSMNLQAFYGPLAFAVSLILWAYVSSLVLVLGALLTPLPRAAHPRGGRGRTAPGVGAPAA